MRPALCAFLLFPAALRADGLADLRTALKGLPASQPVKAVVDCQVWSRSGKAKSPKIVQGQARARVEDGPAGLRLGWDKAELDRVQAAAKAKDGGPERAMGELRAEKAEALVDAARALLDTLEGAQLREDTAEAWQGRPAHRLAFTLADTDMDEEGRKHLKSFTHTLQVWVGADGLPLALSEQLDMKLSVLFIGVEVHHHAERTFARTGDRLVAVHDASQDSGSGAGEQGDQKTVMDLRF